MCTLAYELCLPVNAEEMKQYITNNTFRNNAETTKAKKTLTIQVYMYIYIYIYVSIHNGNRTYEYAFI